MLVYVQHWRVSRFYSIHFHQIRKKTNQLGCYGYIKNPAHNVQGGYSEAAGRTSAEGKRGRTPSQDWVSMSFVLTSIYLTFMEKNYISTL